VLSSTAFRNPETRSVKCKIAQKPFQHSGYREFKRQGVLSSTAFRNPETRSAKCKSRPKAISAFRLPGVQETRGAFFHCIGNPRNPKREMKKCPGAVSAFWLPGLQRTKGSLLYVFSLGHPPWKRQLMNIEQVVETSAQAMNAGHGGVGRQSAQDRPCVQVFSKEPCRSDVLD
jgi:hypothetical protein